jgi:hypothetical protein
MPYDNTLKRQHLFNLGAVVYGSGANEVSQGNDPALIAIPLIAARYPVMAERQANVADFGLARLPKSIIVERYCFLQLFYLLLLLLYVIHHCIYSVSLSIEHVAFRTLLDSEVAQSGNRFAWLDISLSRQATRFFFFFCRNKQLTQFNSGGNVIAKAKQVQTCQNDFREWQADNCHSAQKCLGVHIFDEYFIFC